MSEEEVGAHSRHAAGAKPRQQIQRLFGSHIQHDHVCDEKNQSTSKVLGYDQYQHISGSHCRCDHMILKRSSFPVQPAGNKKHKDDLHKLSFLIMTGITMAITVAITTI